MRVVAMVSGGKDSCYNMMQCVAEGHQIVALANLHPKDKGMCDMNLPCEKETFLARSATIQTYRQCNLRYERSVLPNSKTIWSMIYADGLLDYSFSVSSRLKRTCE